MNRHLKQNNNRARLAQNFFTDKGTVKKLVALADLSRDDYVIEIGPGNGIITQALGRVVRRVTAIELDKQLTRDLKSKFDQNDRIEILQQDFLAYDLPATACKLFANIPFNLTAPIMRKLLFADAPPVPIFFVMQKEAGEKFAVNHGSTESSALYQPWFEFEILADISRFEFKPVPSVDAVLLKMNKRLRSDLLAEDKDAYFRFVTYGFRQWKKSLKLTYKPVFSYPQWKRLAKDNKFPIDAQPSRLTLEQWVALFKYFQSGVSPEKKTEVLNFDPDQTLGKQNKRTAPKRRR